MSIRRQTLSWPLAWIEQGKELTADENELLRSSVMPHRPAANRPLASRTLTDGDGDESAGAARTLEGSFVRQSHYRRSDDRPTGQQNRDRRGLIRADSRSTAANRPI